MSLPFVIMAQHVSNVNDPGLQQAAPGLSGATAAHEEVVHAAPSIISHGLVREQDIQQTAGGIVAAGHWASSSVATGYRRAAGNAFASDFRKWMVANTSESVKTTFEDLWSESWGAMEEVVHHSAPVRNYSSSRADSAARKLRLAPQLSSRNSTGDNARDSGSNGKGTAPSMSPGMRGRRGGASGLANGTAVATGLRMVSGTKTEVETTTKSDSKSEVASGTITDSAVEVAKEESAHIAIHVPLERSVNKAPYPTLQIVDSSDFAAQRTANLRTKAEYDDTKDERKDSADTSAVNDSVAFSRGVAHSRVKRLVVRSHVVDGAEASGGGLRQSVVEQSPKKARRISTGQADIAVRAPNHQAVQVRQASVARTGDRPRSPEQTSEAKPVSSRHKANETVGAIAPLTKRRAGTLHAGAEAKIHSEPAAHAFARAPDVSVADDFLNTVDSATFNGPTARLLTAARDLEARGSRIARRISLSRGRVHAIQSNVGALAAALANADKSQ